MSNARVPREGTSLIVIGVGFPVNDFNPSNLYTSEILIPSDLEGHSVKFFLPDELVSFQTKFANIEVEQGKIGVSGRISAPIPEKIRDISMNLLQLIGSRAITAFGINHDLHFPVSTTENYRNIRHKFLKLDVWGDDLDDPLLLSLALQQERRDGRNGKVNVRIEPSVQINTGVYVNINDHFELPSIANGAEVSDLIFKVWDETQERAASINSRVRKLGDD